MTNPFAALCVSLASFALKLVSHQKQVPTFIIGKSNLNAKDAKETQRDAKV